MKNLTGSGDIKCRLLKPCFGYWIFIFTVGGTEYKYETILESQFERIDRVRHLQPGKAFNRAKNELTKVA